VSGAETVPIPRALVEALRGARAVAVLTGSGVSTESGVPTFRDAQTGLWAHYDPADLATPEAFERDPELVWGWYEWRRKLVREVAPNPGHLALAELERRVSRFTLITQNVDGLHQRAGGGGVIELHGNITRTKCSAEDVMVEDFAPESAPPVCPSCGAPLRPDVVWFGETLPTDALRAASEAASSCDLFFSVGTSGLVQPAASLPLEALRGGATVVEVNPDETTLTRSADYVLRGKAGEVLPALVEVTRG
jgi:NAD-dependent deacetylase